MPRNCRQHRGRQKETERKRQREMKRAESAERERREMPLSKAPYSPNICSPGAVHGSLTALCVLHQMESSAGDRERERKIKNSGTKTSEQNASHQWTCSVGEGVNYLSSWSLLGEERKERFVLECEWFVPLCTLALRHVVTCVNPTARPYVRWDCLQLPVHKLDPPLRYLLQQSNRRDERQPAGLVQLSRK
ncbi:unnamed protein product [Pleuronectes platessa]|uniref:Uncharacterized protein n=1 Tax=Pleuronectes platessa TaxID=8262 RepID=A0A9N7Z4N5_PLEPL|nr:unnamed protein product [Pleuronectes platessa]